MVNPQNASGTNEKIAFLNLEHDLPGDVVKIGSGKFGDSGFSTNCTFEVIMVTAGYKARDMGANIVKVVSIKAPDLWSTCYRVKVDYYRYAGDVRSLKQYPLRFQ